MESERNSEGGVRLLIAGGGTGGHLFPAVAIAEEFLRRDSSNSVLFIGTERGLENRVLGAYGYPLRTMQVEGIRGRGAVKSLMSLSRIPRGMMQARSIIRDFAPHVVLGVGGYASGPAVMTACLMGIPTAIAEQNALPGCTNRILGRFVQSIFLAFPDGEGVFPARKVVVTGNPVRREIWEDSETTGEDREMLRLLIFGGSQGASTINRVVTESLHHLEDLKEGLMFLHQTGEGEYAGVSKAYLDRGLDAAVTPFISDMASAYRWADLVICRAGATSIAEITAAGKASILIPFPFAVGNHQVLNARVLHDAGAATMILEDDLSGHGLAGLLRSFHGDRKMIRKMARQSKKLGRKKAAADIVDGCLALQRV